MSNTIDRETLYRLADKFIALANELAQQDPSGNVGTALRYAAARYSAFESSLLSQDLAAEREQMHKIFADDFGAMLEENLETYIRLLNERGGHG